MVFKVNKYYTISTENPALIHKSEPIKIGEICEGVVSVKFVGEISLASHLTKLIFFEPFSSTYLMFDGEQLRKSYTI